METCAEEAEVRAVNKTCLPSLSLSISWKPLEKHKYPKRNNQIESELSFSICAFEDICILINCVGLLDSRVVACSLAGDPTAKPLTVSHFLSHVVLQSFRYVSHPLLHSACFHTCLLMTFSRQPALNAHCSHPLLSTLAPMLMSTAGHTQGPCLLPGGVLPCGCRCSVLYDHGIVSCSVCGFFFPAKCLI